jgi:hypothetical protein
VLSKSAWKEKIAVSTSQFIRALWYVFITFAGMKFFWIFPEFQILILSFFKTMKMTSLFSVQDFETGHPLEKDFTVGASVVAFALCLPSTDDPGEVDGVSDQYGCTCISACRTGSFASRSRNLKCPVRRRKM